MRFSPLDSSVDFMGRGGLRFSLSLIVSELWRHQWRHNEQCGLPPGREPRSVAASTYLFCCMWLMFLLDILLHCPHMRLLSFCCLLLLRSCTERCVICLSDILRMWSDYLSLHFFGKMWLNRGCCKLAVFCKLLAYVRSTLVLPANFYVMRQTTGVIPIKCLRCGLWQWLHLCAVKEC